MIKAVKRHLKCKKFILLKANFLHLKGLEKNIRKPPDCTGNEPTPDMHIGQSGKDIQTAK